MASGMGHTQLLWAACASLPTEWKKYPVASDLNLPFSLKLFLLVLWLLTVWKVCFCPIYNLLLSNRRLQWSLPRPFSSAYWTSTALSAFLHKRCAPALSQFSWPSSGPAPAALCLSCAAGSRFECSTPDWPDKGQLEGGSPPPPWWPPPVLMQPRMQLFFQDGSICFWLTSGSGPLEPACPSLVLLPVCIHTRVYHDLGAAPCTRRCWRCVCVGLLPILGQAPFNGIPSFCTVSCITQLGIVCKLAGDTLNPSVYVIDEDVEEHWFQKGPMGDLLSLASTWMWSHWPQCFGCNLPANYLSPE